MTTADPFRVRPLTDAELARLDAEDLLEDERRCLGAAMRDNTLLGGAMAGLLPEHFFLPAHRELFATMLEWHSAGFRFDLDRLNLASAHRRSLQDLGGAAYLRQLLDHGRQSLGNIGANARVLRRKATLKEVASGQWSVAGESSGNLQAAGSKQETPPSPGNPENFLTTLAEVEAKPVNWIWEPYLPAGAVAVLSGDPGVGKSYLALAMAKVATSNKSQVTSEKKAVFGSRSSAVGQESATSNTSQVTQESTPVRGPAENCELRTENSSENRELRTENSSADVLYLGASDNAEQILRPRFEALGGDARRLHLLRPEASFQHSVSSFQPRGNPQPSRKLETGNRKLISLLDAALRQTGARLVIVDPLESFLAAEGIGPRSQKFRRWLDELAGLAQAHHCCVLLVRTLGHTRAERPGTGVLGPIELAGVVRSHLVAGCSSTDPAQRVLLHVKSNWGPLAPALGYSIDEAGSFRWTGPSSLTLEQMLTPAPDPEHKSVLDEAEDFLRVMLAAGPERATTIQKEARELGIAHATLRRAKQRLGVRSRKHGGEWKWAKAGNTYHRDTEYTESATSHKSQVTSENQETPSSAQPPTENAQKAVASEDNNKQPQESATCNKSQVTSENQETPSSAQLAENREPRTENFDPIEHLEHLPGRWSVASGQ